MGSLIPTPRTDKNGRTVIRHVRAANPNYGGSRAFPAPALTSTSSDHDVLGVVKDTREHIKEFLTDMKLGFFEKRRMMKTLDRDTLPVLAEHGIGGERGGRIPSDLLGICIRDGKLTFLNDFAAYVDDHGIMDTRHGYGNYDTCMYLMGLRGGKATNDLMAPFGFSPYSEADSEERDAQHAVIEAARTLNKNHVVTEDALNSMTPVIRVRSYTLVDYIKAHPEKTEEVVRIINDRGISPYEDGLEDIEGLMNARDEISAPLAEGAL